MRIPNYVFDARLYEGEATLVYAGVREPDRLPVVGKMVTGGLRDLRTELAIMHKLAGPGVVEALGLFDSSEGPVLVQRRFGDGNLLELLRAGPVPVQRVLSIGRQLSEVLARIHGARVLHRDIKPANVLFDSVSGTIAVADFGLAVELPVGARALPVTDLVGTPAYLSPEQTGRMREGCDSRSDLYSLGATLYQLLTGTLPFPATDLLELVAAHLSTMAEPPLARMPSLPPILSDIVMKLLEKSPDQRYQSARGVAIDLAKCEAALRDEGTIAPFALGRSDLVRPRASLRLYGRDQERAAFARGFARAASGAPTLVLVSGREGSGRSEFVRALVRTEAISSPVAVGGWKAAGERPLSGLSEALETLGHSLLLLDDNQLQALRARLGERLGQVGQVVVEIAPAFENVLGAQPELAALGAAEARGRLQHAFRRFAAALGEEHVFVLSLANVEHADPASLQLVETLLDSAEGGRVLVVLSAREPAGFGALAAREGAISVELGPLSVEALTTWTAALLDCGVARAAPLAAVLHDKSAGNAGLFSSLVEHFLDTGLIARTEGAFTWDLESVRAAKAPPSLGALAAQRVAELVPPQRALLAAVASTEESTPVTALAAMVEEEPAGVLTRLATLEREGLVVASSKGGYGVAHPAIAETALATVASESRRAMWGRLAAHLLRSLDAEALAASAYQVAAALTGGDAVLSAEEQVRAAGIYALAAEQATGLMAYDIAARFFSSGVALLGEGAWECERVLLFRLEVGLARSLMMLGQHERAEDMLKGLCERELSPEQLGIVYPSRVDNRGMVMNRTGAVDVGLEGLARLGFPMPPEPTPQQAFGTLLANEAKLATMTVEQHLARDEVKDERALAAVKIISTLSLPLNMTGQGILYVLTLETALTLHLEHGLTPYFASLLATHSFLLHSRLDKFDAARAAYEACEAVQLARPAPAIDGRTYLALYYLIRPWFSPWKESLEPLAKAIQLAVEAGDPMFAALSASASVTLMSMCGLPLDRIVSAIEGWSAVMKGDGGVVVNAGNVHNLAGKLSRGEAIEQSDLDRVTAVSLMAGAMRNNAMVNLALALTVIGHEAQVRAWFEDVRVSFPKVNASQPHLVTLWLMDGLFAARDAQGGQLERLAYAEQMAENLRKLSVKTKTKNHEPAIALLEAEMARAKGELDRASGLYGRAASEARARDLTPLVAYAMEQRAMMAERAGYVDEAELFYREAVIAYRRWAHLTKVRELEHARPQLRTLELSRSDSNKTAARRHVAGASRTNHATRHDESRATNHGTINESLDLGTVLKISQEISTQLHSSGVVQTVLLGIAQNAGADRVVYIQRAASGEERAYGEAVSGAYRNLGESLSTYTGVPHSVLRLARRTARPVIVADAMNESGHAADPFVVASRCRSIAVVPIMKKGALAGFVLLENRLVPGAFTPQLVSLTQALVAQAAISLDNASLYEDMESRVQERTAALHARTAEMRLVFDNVAQGMMMVDREGRLSAEASAILGLWFPEGLPTTIAGFFAHDPLFSAGWDQLIDGFLPPELCIDQLPKHLRRGEQIFELSWRPILDAQGELARMLVVMSDITEALRRQEAEQEQKQMMAIFEKLSQDRNGVIEFAKEAANIVRELETSRSNDEVEKRLVHTLKGNASFFGLSGLSSLCHDVESAMVADTRGLFPEERAEICAAWKAIDARLGRFLDVGGNYMQVRRPDFDAALRALVREGHPIAQELELWKLEALEARFQRIGEQAQALAERLGKAPVRVVSEHGGIRISGELWTPVWSAFVHAVRNAVDHGLETPEERVDVGKGTSMLKLKAYFSGPSFIIEFSDDGRGIAWEKVRAKAHAAGLPSATHDDLVAALFSDGISTKDAADENSGRGVGMSALRDAVTALDATITVESSPGVGTTWRFTFPSHLAKLPRERKSSLMPSAYPAN